MRKTKIHIKCSPQSRLRLTDNNTTDIQHKSRGVFDAYLQRQMKQIHILY